MSALIQPFHLAIPESELIDLRRRLELTRWPEKETVDDWSQGVPLAQGKALIDYWRTNYDWRRCESRLNDLGQFTTEIDGVDIHFIHVKSQHDNALPLVITHGWPGSVLEFMKLIPLLAAVALLPMIGLPVLMLRLGRLVHDRFEAVQSQFSQLTTRAQENLSGVRVVRAYRQEQAETARFVTLGDTYLTANMRLAKLNGLMNPGFGLLAGLGGAVTIGVGGRLLIQGQVTVGGYVAFGIYLAQLTWPLIALGWTTNLFQRAAASMTRVLELLDAEPLSVQDSSAAKGIGDSNPWMVCS